MSDILLPNGKKIDLEQVGVKETTTDDAISNETPIVATMWPIFKDITTAEITSPFGTRELNGHQSNHTGVDLRCAAGTALYCPYAGTVSYKSGLATGRTIFVKVPIFNLEIIIGHLSKVVSTLEDGEEHAFKVGSVLGYSGGDPSTAVTNELTTGPHVHIGVKVNGTFVDPLPYIDHEKKTTSVTPTVIDPNPPSKKEVEDQTNWVGKFFGVSGVILASLLAVGFLSEAIQAQCWCWSRTTKSDSLKKLLVWISSIPGFKHLDWHNLEFSDPSIKKDWFTALKRADYDNRKFIVKATTADFSLKTISSRPARRGALVDVDFDDTIIMTFEDGTEIYAVYAGEYQNERSNTTDEPLMLLGGYGKNGVLYVAQEVPWNESEF